jgi:tetratricopeptide (TPR) repeat protein
MLASAYATIFHARGPEDGNARGTLQRMLKACHESGSAPASRESSGYVRALAHLLFAVALGADEAAADAELLKLNRRLAALTDDAAAMQELLAVRRVRITPQQDRLDRIVMLIQHWTQEYVAAGGSYTVGCALADDFLALIRAAPHAYAAAQRRLCWLAATICAYAGDAPAGERYAREGLSLADGEAGLWRALLESVLGDSLFQQGELAAARPLVVSAFESLLVLQGAGHGDTGVALRRVVEVLEAQGDMKGAASFAAQRLRQLTEIPLNAAALNDSAWWIVRWPRRSAEHYELALGAAEAAARLGPDIADRQNTLGVAQYRVGRFADAVATLKRSDELRIAGGGTPQVADWALLAMAHVHLGQFEEAGRCLVRAEEIAGTAGNVADENAAFLAEARTLLAGR